ncbi:MAG: serine protease [Ignavibacteria bacterium]|nr:serine protease [Ignavibacteria bacterium]
MKIFFYNNFIFIIRNLYSQKTAKEIYDKNTSKVVYIEIYDRNKKPTSRGSGFLINSEGLIVTNYHVIKNAFYAKVFYSDGAVSDANYIYNYTEDFDLALLKSFLNTDEHVDLSSSDDVSIGDKCYAIGSPLGVQNTISDGIISNILSDDKDYFFQITNPISPGSSGGALFDDLGNLIGVTFASNEEGQNLNYAIPSKYVSQLLNRSYKPITLLEFQKRVNKVIIVETVSPNHSTSPSTVKNPESFENKQYIDYGFDPSNYNINASYIFNTSVLTNDFPENVKFDDSYSISFAYMFNSYVGMGLLYQNNNLKNTINNNKLKLDFYRGDLFFKTSEERLKVNFGFGVGLAYSQLVHNKESSYSSDTALIKIDKAQNLLLASFFGGIEFRIIQNASVSINVPFDYVFLTENEPFGLVSPAIGINFIF